MAVLWADRVSVRAGNEFLVDDVSVKLAPGQLLGIVGPNGAGKSTLLRLLAGLLTPTGGTVYLGTTEMEQLSPADLARQLAWVPQSVAEDLDFTVLDVVLMGRYARSRGWRETANDRRIAQAALELTGVAHLAHREYRTLSGGEQQRVILARALAQEPRVLLLDEPTSSLDLRYQLEVLEITKRLAERQGVAVAIALHDLTLAARFCHQLLLLSQGRAVATGSPTDVLTPEMLRVVYGIEALVEKHPRLGHLVVSAVAVVNEGEPEEVASHGQVAWAGNSVHR